MERKVHSTAVIQAVRNKAENNPDFIYNQHFDECRYVDKFGNGACLIGQALIEAGIDPERLDVDAEVIDMYEDFIIKDELLHIDWLQEVQLNQDSGEGFPWPTCVMIADQAIPEVAKEVK